MPDVLAAVPVDGWRDPASVFAAIAESSEHCFWLDAGPDATDGWSWVGAGEVEEHPERVRSVSIAAPSTRQGWDAGPFRGGWVGWLGYEAGAHRAGAPVSASDHGIPGERWLRVERYVAFDHARRRVWAIAPRETGRDLADLVGASRTPAVPVASVPVTPALVDTPPADTPPADTPAAEATGRHTPDAYAALVERCRSSIARGDAYQLCLTTRFSVNGPVDPVAAYRRLRDATPAHHGGLVRSGGVALASASPERFLQVAEGVVRTRPIKGTRPRSADPSADAALARELSQSPKERAENIMIVDLMRNDLSRVCEPGTVGADRLLEIESYPAVHQLVSTVSGTLTPGIRLGALLDATFPAGSMTGAPKLSAMSLLHGLEQAPRGVFSGCFGWVGDDGALDLAMVIRSIVTHPDGAYVGAGGGITWRSEAAAEVAEVGVKARSPLAAIGAALPPGW